MSAVYENVIVPNDGSLEGRVVFAPAADLAWRLSARLVQVSNTEATDKSSRATVKGQAIAHSAADVEFWVDVDHDLASAVLTALSYRPDSMLCVGSPGSKGSFMGRRRSGMQPLAAAIVGAAPVPVMVVGPKADTSRGLPMSELVVVLDGTPAGDGVLALAAEWAHDYKLRLVLTYVTSGASPAAQGEQQDYLDQRAASLQAVGGVAVELVQGDGGPEALARLLERHPDAVVMTMSGARRGSPGPLASALVEHSPRAVLLAAG